MLFRSLALAFAFVFLGCSSGSASTTTTTVTAPVATTSAPVAAPTSTTTVAPSSTSTSAAIETTTTTSPGIRIEVVVAGGEVRSVLRQEVPLGEAVTISVSSDTADEVHVHTYDVFADVEAGGTVVLEFEADIPGIFEVELESTHLQILELVVQ